MKSPSPVRTVTSLVVRLALATLLLFVVSGLGFRFVPVPEGGSDAAAADASFFALLLSLFFLQTVAIAYPIVRSRWSGWRLVLVAFLVYFGPVTLLTQIETFLYLDSKLSAEMQRGIWLMGLFNAAAFAPLVVLVLGGWRRDRSAGAAGQQPASVFSPLGFSPLGFSPLGFWARVGLLAAVFAALYYLFGYYVAWKDPVLRDYYGGTDPGSFLAQMRSVFTATPWMPPLQFLRGVLAVVIAVPVVRMMKGAWWESGLALSLLFVMPSLYLLLPNVAMPEAVSRVHLVETVPYQFLFGWLVAWVLRAPAVGEVASSTASRAAEPKAAPLG